MILFTREETKYILETLRKQTAWWVRDSIISKLEDDTLDKYTEQCCEHDFYNWVGEKVACTKCGVTLESSFTRTTKEQVIPEEDRELGTLPYSAAEIKAIKKMIRENVWGDGALLEADSTSKSIAI